MKTSKQIYGFTLAEVLITLGVIGVVAAMTIPTLISNYQKTQYVTGLKKAYTNFNEVLKQMTQDYGCDDLTCTCIFGAYNTTAFGDIFASHFKILKNCKLASNGCMSDSVSDYYDGTHSRFPLGSFGYYSFVAADGVSYMLYSYQNNCAYDNGTSSHISKDMEKPCAVVFVDVNGPNKKPNNFGRDLFEFYITDGHGPMLYPRGGPDDFYPWRDSSGTIDSCDKSVSTFGDDCAGRIIEEGWQMNY